MKKWYQFLSINFLILFSAHYSAISQSTTFSYTTTIQMWTVPVGVVAILVDAQGAKGGAAGPIGPMLTSSTPGCGGRVQATMAVTPGQVLSINVGGPGTDGVGFTTTPGGYNGGGFTTPWTPSAPTYSGGGGGGKTDISVGGNQMIVSGGGGGGGYNGACSPGDQPGANGGGLTGATAVTCTATLTGLGFTVIRGSGGGSSAAGGIGGYICCGGYYAGTGGSFGTGGNNVDSGGVGGGGGGGYYGGGGGCWMGGGGGSSYTNPLYVTAVTHTQGYNCGPGTVIICILPDPGTITGITSLCGGDTTTLASGVTGGTWSSSNLPVATVGTTGLVTGISAGTAIISYSVTNACGSYAATKTVTVNVPTAGTITGIDSVCPGHTDTLSNTITGGVWSNFNGALATVGSSSGIVTGLTPGIDTIYYTVIISGCSAKAKIAVKVRTHAACIVGINTISNEVAMLKITPNPNPGQFTVNLSSGIDEETHFIITNIVGEKIREVTGSTNHPVSIQLDVPGGIYFLSAKTVHGNCTNKVMVVK